MKPISCVVSGFHFRVAASSVMTVAQVRTTAVEFAQAAGLASKDRPADSYEMRDALGYTLDPALIAASIEPIRTPLFFNQPIGWGG